MDSVDRYVEHEARDNQHINSPSLLSQLLNTDQQIEKYIQSYNSSQPPTVWDIEVPKVSLPPLSNPLITSPHY